MRPLLAFLTALRHRTAPPIPYGAIPYGAGGMLSQEWLAPHLVRLPDLRSARTPDA